MPIVCYDINMRINTVDLSKILKSYSSIWLALEPNSLQVVATGKKPGIVLQAARKKGISHPVLTRAPKDYGTYIL